MKSEISFLGMTVREGEIKVVQKKVSIPRYWPKTTNITDVPGFMSLLQFFLRFIEDFS